MTEKADNAMRHSEIKINGTATFEIDANERELTERIPVYMHDKFGQIH